MFAGENWDDKGIRCADVGGIGWAEVEGIGWAEVDGIAFSVSSIEISSVSKIVDDWLSSSQYASSFKIVRSVFQASALPVFEVLAASLPLKLVLVL